MSSRRPRRSRIYDSNYNIGENYYKSAIDRLDAKYHPSLASSSLLRHSEPPAVSPTRPKFVRALADDLQEEDLEFSRDRASRAIQRETVLDQRSSRRGLDLESSFDGQVSNHFSKINFVSQERRKFKYICVRNGNKYLDFHSWREEKMTCVTAWTKMKNTSQPT